MTGYRASAPVPVDCDSSLRSMVARDLDDRVRREEAVAAAAADLPVEAGCHSLGGLRMPYSRPPFGRLPDLVDEGFDCGIKGCNGVCFGYEKRQGFAGCGAATIPPSLLPFPNNLPAIGNQVGTVGRAAAAPVLPIDVVHAFDDFSKPFAMYPLFPTRQHPSAVQYTHSPPRGTRVHLKQKPLLRGRFRKANGMNVTTRTSTVWLPSDILDRIFEIGSILQGPTYLLACALVCKDWEHPALRILYGRVAIRNLEILRLFAIAVGPDPATGEGCGELFERPKKRWDYGHLVRRLGIEVRRGVGVGFSRRSGDQDELADGIGVFMPGGGGRMPRRRRHSTAGSITSMFKEMKVPDPEVETMLKGVIRCCPLMTGLTLGSSYPGLLKDEPHLTLTHSILLGLREEALVDIAKMMGGVVEAFHLRFLHSPETVMAGDIVLDDVDVDIHMMGEEEDVEGIGGAGEAAMVDEDDEDGWEGLAGGRGFWQAMLVELRRLSTVTVTMCDPEWDVGWFTLPHPETQRVTTLDLAKAGIRLSTSGLRSILGSVGSTLKCLRLPGDTGGSADVVDDDAVGMGVANGGGWDAAAIDDDDDDGAGLVGAVGTTTSMACGIDLTELAHLTPNLEELHLTSEGWEIRESSFTQVAWGAALAMPAVVAANAAVTPAATTAGQIQQMQFELQQQQQQLQMMMAVPEEPDSMSRREDSVITLLTRSVACAGAVTTPLTAGAQKASPVLSRLRLVSIGEEVPRLTPDSIVGPPMAFVVRLLRSLEAVTGTRGFGGSRASPTPSPLTGAIKLVLCGIRVEVSKEDEAFGGAAQGLTSAGLRDVAEGELESLIRAFRASGCDLEVLMTLESRRRRLERWAELLKGMKRK
ncbi:hypothetical protein HK101_000441 [Irineochytrium annulatum]|nr:hypothetical protein HK101_000441 [Irineochytrium annulatum]